MPIRSPRRQLAGLGTPGESPRRARSRPARRVRRPVRRTTRASSSSTSWATAVSPRTSPELVIADARFLFDRMVPLSRQELARVAQEQETIAYANRRKARSRPSTCRCRTAARTSWLDTCRSMSGGRCRLAEAAEYERVDAGGTLYAFAGPRPISPRTSLQEVGDSKESRSRGSSTPSSRSRSCSSHPLRTASLRPCGRRRPPGLDRRVARLQRTEFAFDSDATDTVDPASLTKVGCSTAFPVFAPTDTAGGGFTQLYVLAGTRLFSFTGEEPPRPRRPPPATTSTTTTTTTTTTTAAPTTTTTHHDNDTVYDRSTTTTTTTTTTRPPRPRNLRRRHGTADDHQPTTADDHNNGPPTTTHDHDDLDVDDDRSRRRPPRRHHHHAARRPPRPRPPRPPPRQDNHAQPTCTGDPGELNARDPGEAADAGPARWRRLRVRPG